MGEIKMILRTKNYAGMLIKTVRVYTNDPVKPETTVGVEAFVKAPIYVSPPYVSFYSPKNETPSLAVEIKAGLAKPLTLESEDFSLKGEVAYRVDELEKGRRFRVVLHDLPGGSEKNRGYLNLKTDYPETPVVHIKIIGRFVEKERTAWVGRPPAS
jgi:hypothetical protein